MHRLLIVVTILGLFVILADAQAPSAPRVSSKRVNQKSPSEVARRFVRLESSLLPDQWSRLSDFFIQTPKPQWNKVDVVDIINIAVKTKGNSTHVYISTNSLGKLDSSLRLSDYPPTRLPLGVPSTSACYGDDYFEFNLLLAGKERVVPQSGTPDQFQRPLAWRIADSSFEPLITLDTAIRYVRQMHDKAENPAMKRNATRSLRILEYYKQGKFLPDELSSGSTGGCFAD
ncbi:MAG: hypothetical protein ACHQIK_11280 [Candidatus Acidiferrales bacterium]